MTLETFVETLPDSLKNVGKFIVEVKDSGAKDQPFEYWTKLFEVFELLINQRR